MLVLTCANWYQELDAIARANDMPQYVLMALRGLINCFLNNAIQPTVLPEAIADFKRHLPNAVNIDGRPYEIVFFVPYDPSAHRQFATLVPWYPGGRLVPLNNMP